MNGSFAKVRIARRTRAITLNSCYLLLAILIFADLARSGFRASEYLHGPVLVAGVSPLDSFSEPSTAAAILKEEAEKLLFEYTEARNAAWSGEIPVGLDSVQTGAQTSVESNPHRFAGFVRGSALELSRVRPLEKLQITVRDLNLEVYQKLLVVYSENHFDNELVNTFLNLLNDAPERPEVLDWVRITLERSQDCQRTQEVQDALQHTLRFHPDLKTAVRLRDLKETWDAMQRGQATAQSR
jgi:hypothetical protein